MSTFTISRQDWRNALVAVLAHAGTDRTLPVIRAVQIDCDAKGITFVGTDRYTLGVYRHDFTDGDENAPEPFSFLLDRFDADDSLKLFKVQRGFQVPLRVTVDDVRMSLHDDVGDPGLTVVVKSTDGVYPKWRGIVDDVRAKDKELAEGIALNGHYLARWSKAARVDEPVRIVAHGEHGAILVSVGPNFIGLQMPVRLSTTAPATFFDTDRWAPIITPPPAPAPKRVRKPKAKAS